jgi:hypothetical protein
MLLRDTEERVMGDRQWGKMKVTGHGLWVMGKRKKEGYRSWVMGYGTRKFFVFFVFITYNLLPITYDLLPITYYPSSTCAQDTAQQKQQQVKRTIEEERLNILKGDIQKEIEQYKKLKKDIDDAQKSLEEKNQEKLVKVVKMFEAMPAEEAARRMEKLDEDIAVSILASLKPKAAGKILAQMESEKAAALSQKILARGKVSQEKTSR